MCLTVLNFRLTELEYLRLQYWAVTASCLSVLVFLRSITRCQPKSAHSASSPSVWESIFSLCCIGFCATLCCVSFAANSNTSKLTTLYPLSISLFITCDDSSTVLRVYSVKCQQYIWLTVLLDNYSTPKLVMNWIVMCSLYRLLHNISVNLGTLSWIGSNEINSARSSYFPKMCFDWYVFHSPKI